MSVSRVPQDTLLQQILAEFKEMNGEIAGLRVEMYNFKKTLESMTKIILGDGVVHSITTHVELLRQELGYSKESILHSELRIKELETTANKIDQEDKRGRWAVLAAIVTGIIGLMGMVATLLVALFKP